MEIVPPSAEARSVAAVVLKEQADNLRMKVSKVEATGDKRPQLGKWKRKALSLNATANWLMATIENDYDNQRAM